jgi:cytochrome c553
MWSHFDAAADLHAAVVRGDLPVARDAASWLAEHGEPDLPEGSQPLLDQMRASARRVASAADLSEAARGTADVARSCGACHAAYGPGPVFRGSGVPPVEGAGVTLEMRRHDWAAGRLWEGLIGPSDAAWAAGARVLGQAAFGPDAMMDRTELPPNAPALERRVHDIGRRAAGAADTAARAELYGELLGTCAACHTAAHRGS